MFRHWRIRVSLICFTLFLAVIVLWVRSYSWDDTIDWNYKSAGYREIVSVRGLVSLISATLATGSPQLKLGWKTESIQVTQKLTDEVDSFLKTRTRGVLGFHFVFASNGTFIIVPYWFLSVVFGLLCGLPWYWRRFNFSLRTFLIAFTVLAVVLGFVGWLTRLPVPK